MHVLVHYDEIALKRGKRRYFEHALLDELEERLGCDGVLDSSRLHLTPDCERDIVVEELDHVFGVKNYAFPVVTEPDIDAMRDAARRVLGDAAGSVAVDAKRGDKEFSLTSKEIEEVLGDVAVDLGLSVDLDSPDTTVYVEVTEDNAYVYCEKFEGLGGLPVGTAGDVLCLLSGGIDSPVAAWYLMKRGCTVDFVHFNPYRTGEEALDAKLGDVLGALNAYQGGCEVFFAPYGVYQLASSVDSQFDLVVFRNCMLRTAAALAQEHGYEAVVMGDSVAQVASQTLENVSAAEVGIDFPVFRPLLGFDKDEIVEQARCIGTYEASVREYKDCCSIIADSPNTGVSRERMRDVLSGVDMDGIVEKTVEEVERVSLEE